MAPALMFCKRVFLLTSSYTCTLCQMLPSIPLWLASRVLAPAGGMTESPNRVLRIPVSHDCEESVFLSLLYIRGKLFELGVEVAFYNGSTVTHHKVNLLRFPRRSSCCERMDDTFVLLICFCFFHL